MLKNNLGKFYPQLLKRAIVCNRTSSEILPVVPELTRSFKHPIFRELPSAGISYSPQGLQVAPVQS